MCRRTFVLGGSMFLLALSLAPRTVVAEVEAFALSEGNEGGAALHRIDLATGQAEPVGTFHNASGDSYLSYFGGLAFDDTGRLLGSRFLPYDPETRMILGNWDEWELVEIDTETATVTPIGRHEAPPYSAVQSLDLVGPGSRYGEAGFLAGHEMNAALGSVDVATGKFTPFQGDLKSGAIGGLAYDGRSDTLYGINQWGTLYRFDPETYNSGPGVAIFEDGHEFQWRFATDDINNPYIYSGTLGAAFNEADGLIYAVAHLAGPSDPDTDPQEDDPISPLREDIFITNNLDALLFTIDVSEFDGENTGTLKTNIIGDTGYHWFGGLAIRQVELVQLQAGDADQDLDFDQLDLVQVQVAAKYLTGQAATWGEGDWDAAPGGEPGNPPQGNGFFDQLDIVAALTAGKYLTGPYPTLRPNDQPASAQASTVGSSSGSLTFGDVAPPSLAEGLRLRGLTEVGPLESGTGLANMDLVYVPVPEPSALVLLMLGLLGFMAVARSR